MSSCPQAVDTQAEGLVSDGDFKTVSLPFSPVIQLIGCCMGALC